MKRHFKIIRTVLTAAILLAFMGLASPLRASDTQIVGVPVVSPSAGLCPGSFFTVSVTVKNTTNNGDEGRIQIAMSPNTAPFATCWTSLQNSVQSNQWFFVRSGTNPATAEVASHDNNWPNGGYVSSPGAMGQKTIVFTLQVPPDVVYGTTYKIHIALN